jgi:hypothetical protein
LLVWDAVADKAVRMHSCGIPVRRFAFGSFDFPYAGSAATAINEVGQIVGRAFTKSLIQFVGGQVAA